MLIKTGSVGEASTGHTENASSPSISSEGQNVNDEKKENLASTPNGQAIIPILNQNQDLQSNATQKELVAPIFNQRQSQSETQPGGVLRSLVIGFYIANEGLSFLENAGRCGVLLSHKLLAVLTQLQQTGEKKRAVKTEG